MTKSVHCCGAKSRNKCGSLLGEKGESSAFLSDFCTILSECACHIECDFFRLKMKNKKAALL